MILPRLSYPEKSRDTLLQFCKRAWSHVNFAKMRLASGSLNMAVQPVLPTPQAHLQHMV